MQVLLIIGGGVTLLIAVSWLAQRLGIVSPLLLLLVGIGVGYISGVPNIILNPEIILLAILPPLLYGAAVNVPVIDLRRNKGPIFGFSFLLVIVTALIIGFGLNFFVPEIPLAVAIALGAVVAPPDAVAATAIGKRVGMPPRLVTILEGESLLNDATSLVLLRTAIAGIAGGFYFWNAAFSFAYAVAAAAIIGFVVGFITVWIRKKLSNPVHSTAFSFIVPFIAFIPAEVIGASGVLAVVITGLYTGHHASEVLSASARMGERLNWRTVLFLLENGVFLIMGLEMHTLVIDVLDQPIPLAHVGLIALAVFAALVVIRMIASFILIFAMKRKLKRYEARLAGVSRVQQIKNQEMQNGDLDTKAMRSIDRLNRYKRRVSADYDHASNEGLGWRGSVILGWSGMRGVVTLAAAQTLPSDVPYRSQIILIAFGAAILSLLVHGFSLPPLVRLLRPQGPSPDKQTEELLALHDTLLSEAIATLDQETGFKDETVERARTTTRIVLAPLKIKGAAINATARLPLTEADKARMDDAKASQLLTRKAVEAAREALLDCRSVGEYSSQALNAAEAALDSYEVRFSPPA